MGAKQRGSPIGGIKKRSGKKRGESRGMKEKGGGRNEEEEEEIVREKQTESEDMQGFCLLAGLSVFPPHPDNAQFDIDYKHRNLLGLRKTRLYITL